MSTVDTSSPPISASAIGVKNELPEVARGTSPMTVVMVLSMIGLNRIVDYNSNQAGHSKSDCKGYAHAKQKQNKNRSHNRKRIYICR